MVPNSNLAGVYPTYSLLAKYGLTHFHDFSVAIR